MAKDRHGNDVSDVSLIGALFILTDRLEAIELHQIMRGFVRHILAIICIAAYICSGQMTACGCALPVKSAKACESNDHSHGPDHQEHAPGTDATCPCVACHACSHAAVVMPHVEIALPTLRSKPVEQAASVSLTGRALEIFTPPKLS